VAAKKVPTEQEKRNPEWRKRAMRVVLHEWASFQRQFDLMVKSTDSDDPARTAAYVAVTVHLRALCDFFCPPRNDDGTLRRDDSITIEDFGGHSKPLPRVLDAMRDATGWEIAHLSYARMDLEPGGPTHPWAKARAEMQKLINASPISEYFRREARISGTANVNATAISSTYHPARPPKFQK
jgi:hypothetical protein